MKLESAHYVPCLRWKQGEYLAVSRLNTPTKSRITPLIVVPEKGYDFESGKETKDINQHLLPVAKRVLQNWGKRHCFVDLICIESGERMEGGEHPLTYVFDQLRKLGCCGIPATGIGRPNSYQKALFEVAKRDGRGVCLRIDLEQAADPGIAASINHLLGGKVDFKDCDLVFDLGSPKFTPLEGLVKLVSAMLAKLGSIGAWRNLTIISTAFPPNMGGVKEGLELIPRSEWIFYKLLIAELRQKRMRVPNFGDYTINHPELTAMDMRFVKPSATIRYATDDHWLLIKGKNVRDNGFLQYRGHCKSVSTSPHYCGPSFSTADKYIQDCGKGGASTGNLTTWRWVGTNHHIEKVVSDLASFFGS